jgi:hypothetical protein
MLSTTVFIFNPIFVAGTTYTLELFYNPASKAKYTNHGDVIEDTLGRQYAVANSTTLPVADGDTLTVTALGANVLPTEDVDYDSTIATPSQVKLSPDVRTSGSLSSPSVFSGPNYEYTVTASWTSSVEANKAVVGDRLIDASGKEFELSFIDGSNRFNVPCRIKEVDKTGDLPVTGVSTLYRSTPNSNFFQGTEVTDAARTVIQNRDAFLVDAALAASGSGASNALEKTMDNNSGSTINKFTPVRVNSSGEMALIDAATEAQVLSTIGVVKANTATATAGAVVLSGILQNVTTSFAVGSDVYLAKDGSITDIPPDSGSNGFVAGDFVVRIGTIMENTSTPAQKDLNVNIQVVGQL